MSSLAYKLGQAAGPSVRKARWIWKSLTGDESDALEAEYAVGRDLANAVRTQLKLSETPRDLEIAGWLNRLGTALASPLRDRRRRFTFLVADMDQPNAFALPGGFIFVSRSLLELCRLDRDEVAFVIGHEMGHVVRGHAIERLMNRTAASAAARALPTAGALAACGKHLGLKLLLAAYSRDQEFEADEFAMRMFRGTDLDPEGATRLLARLQELTRKCESGEISEYLSTHPATADRICRLQSFIR